MKPRWGFHHWPNSWSTVFCPEAQARAAINGLTAGVPGTEAKAEAAIPGLTAGVPGTEAKAEAAISSLTAGVPGAEAAIPWLTAGVPGAEAKAEAAILGLTAGNLLIRLTQHSTQILAPATFLLVVGDQILAFSLSMFLGELPYVY